MSTTRYQLIAMDTFQEAIDTFTSKPVQRAVVNAILLVNSAIALAFTAAIASAVFFHNFIPDQVVTRPVHLQYDSGIGRSVGINPYALVPLSASQMKAQQDYDISITLTMPRSPPNIGMGNFMVSLSLLDKEIDATLIDEASSVANAKGVFSSHTTLFSSRRMALVPYVDPIASLAHRSLFVVYHMFFRASQTIDLTVQLADRFSFPKGTTAPSSAYLEVQAGQAIQVYSAAMTVRAQLKGLRWLMFHYRLPTYLLFTFCFWACEVVFMTLAWMFFNSLKGVSEEKPVRDKGKMIKDEEPEDSDRDHTFPTYGRQPALRYEGRVKQEEEGGARELEDVPFVGEEADDEDDLSTGEEGETRASQGARDSGIGTSYSEEGRESVRRRASRNLRD